MGRNPDNNYVAILVEMISLQNLFGFLLTFTNYSIIYYFQREGGRFLFMV